MDKVFTGFPVTRITVSKSHGKWKVTTACHHNMLRTMTSDLQKMSARCEVSWCTTGMAGMSSEMNISSTSMMRVSNVTWRMHSFITHSHQLYYFHFLQHISLTTTPNLLFKEPTIVEILMISLRRLFLKPWRYLISQLTHKSSTNISLFNLRQLSVYLHHLRQTQVSDRHVLVDHAEYDSAVFRRDQFSDSAK